MSQYTPDDFDKYSCLKPSFGLFLILFLGVKDLLLVVIPPLAQFKSKSTALDYLSELVQPEMFLADLAVLVVWMALINRRPEAKQYWRRIWSSGRAILIGAFSFQAIVLAFEILSNLESKSFVLRRLDMPLVTTLAVVIGCVMAVLLSQRIKDTFKDWPDIKSSD